MTDYEYRYILNRDLRGQLPLDGGDYPDSVFSLDAEKRVIVWVMCNPSTATETTDDATIRRVMDFTRRYGGNFVKVVNLYPVRATDSNVLKAIGADELGYESPSQWAALENAFSTSCHKIIFAWGAVARKSRHHQSAKKVVIDSVKKYGHLAWHIGYALDEIGNTPKEPRHPLYLPKSCLLQKYPLF